MNAIDAGICAILLLAFVVGWRHGLVTQLVSLAGFLIAWYAAYRLTPVLLPHLERWLPPDILAGIGHYEMKLDRFDWEQPLLRVLAFILIVLAVKFSLTLLGYLLNAIARVPGLNGMNRLAGGGLALLEAVVLVSLLVYALSAVPNASFRRTMAKSQAVGFIMSQVPELLQDFDRRLNGR
jgi:uncharacterized membrane protein required for colicin V production